MEMSLKIVEWCENEALGQCLTQWGKGTELSYDVVIELLEDATDLVALYDDYGIMVWTTYEEYSGSWVADQISSLYKSYLNCVKFAREN